jgi:hypothetical protein
LTSFRRGVAVERGHCGASRRRFVAPTSGANQKIGRVEIIQPHGPVQRVVPSTCGVDVGLLTKQRSNSLRFCFIAASAIGLLAAPALRHDGREQHHQNAADDVPL